MAYHYNSTGQDFSTTLEYLRVWRPFAGDSGDSGDDEEGGGLGLGPAPAPLRLPLLERPDRRAFIRHGTMCADGVWAALPFWLSLDERVRARLTDLLGEEAGFDLGARKEVDPNWAPDLQAARKEGLPLFLTAKPGDRPQANLYQGYTVYLLDYCYGVAGLFKLLEEVGPTGRVVVLDHHRTTLTTVEACRARKPALCARLEMVYNDAMSGAEIAWRYARALGIYEGPDSLIKDYVGDRDLWTFVLPDSEAVNLALRINACSVTLGQAAETYKREIRSGGAFLDELKEKGRHYLQAQKVMIKHLAKQAQTAYASARDGSTRPIGRYRVRILNSAVYQSELGSLLAKGTKHSPAPDFSVVWFYSHWRDEIQVSLRRPKDSTLDLSVIAATLEGARSGGGGHAAAAGCTIRGSDVKAVFRAQR